jgi:hypothetical protein
MRQFPIRPTQKLHTAVTPNAFSKKNITITNELDRDKFCTEIVDLVEIYNFVLQIFFIWKHILAQIINFEDCVDSFDRYLLQRQKPLDENGGSSLPPCHPAVECYFCKISLHIIIFVKL